MLDLNLFRTKEGIKKITDDLKKRHASEDLIKAVNEIASFDVLCRALMIKQEGFKAQKNEASKQIAKLQGEEKKRMIEEISQKSEKEKEELNKEAQKAINEIHHLRKLAQKSKLDIEGLNFEDWLKKLILLFPNLTHDSTPEGPDESGNVVESIHGTPKQFDFEPKDHMELGTNLGILNMEEAAKMSGARFAYLLGDAAMLEFALIQFVMQKLVAKGFTPVIPPVLVKEQAMVATGFFPADKNEIYQVNAGADEEVNAETNAGAGGGADASTDTGPNADSDNKKPQDDLFLVGTSEVPLTMLHADKILDLEKLPLRYVAFSSCFRREAGSYGKDTQGIIRVHQFDKLEMFSFCHPDKSWEEHELIRSIEEEIMTELGFAYQVVNICSGDLGYPAAKKYDLEAWIPTQGKYRELTSCSNCTDYQARRAKIRFKKTDGKNEFVHTLNGTACAIGRTLVAIMENYQQADGSIEVPHVLQPFMNGVTVIKHGKK